MNTSQPQDSLRKKLKKLKKRKKVEKERSKIWGLDFCPSPLPSPGKLSIRPPQSKIAPRSLYHSYIYTGFRYVLYFRV